PPPRRFPPDAGFDSAFDQIPLPKLYSTLCAMRARDACSDIAARVTAGTDCVRWDAAAARHRRIAILTALPPHHLILFYADRNPCMSIVAAPFDGRACAARGAGLYILISSDARADDSFSAAPAFKPALRHIRP
ncbi:MAG TPA: hypothetical protein VFM56_08625, partial [Solimonas sp.]|nr:hypothetical protein [Solimonas sp.]